MRNQRLEIGRHLHELADFLQVDPSWLDTGDGPAPDWWRPPVAPAQRHDSVEGRARPAMASAVMRGVDLLVPVVGRAAAAHGAQVDGDTDGEPPLRIRDRWRAVKIHGDSGYPVVLDGQTVLVDPVLPCERNRIVVVHTDDGPQLKRIGDQIDDGRVMLASLNAGRDPKLVRFSDYARAPEVVVAVVFTDSVAR